MKNSTVNLVPSRATHPNYWNEQTVLSLYSNINVHVVIPAWETDEIHHVLTNENEAPILIDLLSISYWRIKSFIQELLHAGTLRRANAAACILNSNQFNTVV